MLHHGRVTIGKEIAHAHVNGPDNQMIIKRIKVHHDVHFRVSGRHLSMRDHFYDL